MNLNITHKRVIIAALESFKDSHEGSEVEEHRGLLKKAIDNNDVVGIRNHSADLQDAIVRGAAIHGVLADMKSELKLTLSPKFSSVADHILIAALEILIDLTADSLLTCAKNNDLSPIRGLIDEVSAASELYGFLSARMEAAK